MLVNEIIIQKIRKLLDSAIKSNLKSKSLYRKILTEFTNYKVSITTKTQIKNIPNVGQKTVDLLLKHINEELKNRIDNLNDLEKYQLLLDINDYNRIKDKLTEYNTSVNAFISDISDSDISMININTKDINSTEAVYSPILKKKNTQVRKEYIPGYRTGPYAILKALWIEDGTTKHKIIFIAKNYSNADFDLTSRNSAWSGMKTLIDKELVYKESGSKKYFLTQKGKDLANQIFKDTSLINNEEEDLVLVIDSREIKSRTCRSFFQNYFDSKDIKYDTRLLEIGDFAWIKNEMICDFIVERKCGSDFVSSLSDGRFKEQKNRLKDTGISNIFYIIENLQSKDFKNISIDYGLSCITSTKLEGITVIETSDIKETASVIEQIHKNIMDLDESKIKMSYGSFIEKGTKSKNTDVNQILLYCFLSIFGINAEKAIKLSEHFKTLNNFYKTKNKEELRKELRDVKFCLSKKNIEDIIKIMYCTKE